MILDLSNKSECNKAETYFSTLKANKNVIELRKITNSRSVQQNKALHKYFNMIAFVLIELGMEFQYTGVKGVLLSTTYTDEIVKNYFWRPIQIALYDIKSTKDINTEQLNGVSEVIGKFFADKGVFIEFPHKD